MYFPVDLTISCDNNPSNSDLLRIPLLKDVFARYPTTPINIDIKVNDDELIKQVTQRGNESSTHSFAFRLQISYKNTDENILPYGEVSVTRYVEN